VRSWAQERTEWVGDIQQALTYCSYEQLGIMNLEGAAARKPRNYMVAPIAIHVIQHIMELIRERYGLRTLVGFRGVRLFR
jgi:hypothetical protein